MLCEQHVFRHATAPGSAATYPEENLAWHCGTSALKKMHLAANPHTAAQRASTRPLSLPLLAPTHQHCSSQMDPGYEWVAYSNSDLVYLGCRGKIEEAIHCWPAYKKTKTQEDKRSLPGLLPLLCAGITIDSSCCSPWFTEVYTGKKLGIWLFILYTGNEIHTQICNWRDQRMPSFLFHMYQNQAWAWGQGTFINPTVLVLDKKRRGSLK